MDDISIVFVVQISSLKFKQTSPPYIFYSYICIYILKHFSSGYFRPKIWHNSAY